MSSGPVQDSSRPRSWQAAGVWLGLILIFSSPWHYRNDIHPANEAARVYAAQAIAQYGTLNLEVVFDLYSPDWRKSGTPPILDVAKTEKAYVLVKAPGATILAVPFVWLSHNLGLNPGFAELTWFLAFLLCGIPTVLLLRQLEKNLGATQSGILIARATVLASPLLAYAGMLFGHALATACIGLGSLFALGSPRNERIPRRGIQFFGGFLIGLAVLSEYTCALIAIFALISLLTQKDRGLRLLAVIAGGTLPLAALLTWNALNFGDPFALSYGFKADASHAAIHSQGIYGISWPSPDRAWGTLFGAQRGLFFLSPWLILGFVGAIVCLRTKEIRGPWRTMLPLTVFGFPIFVSGFVDWTAGLSMGPRHLMPMLPFMALAIHILVESKEAERQKSIWQPLLTGLILSSALIAIIGSYVFPYFDTRTANPFFEVILPVFLEAGSGPTLWNRFLSPNLVLALALMGAAALLIRPKSAKLSFEKGRLFAGILVVAAMLTHLLGAMQIESQPQTSKASVLKARAFAHEMLGQEAFAKQIRDALAPHPANDRLRE